VGCRYTPDAGRSNERRTPLMRKAINRIMVSTMQPTCEKMDYSGTEALALDVHGCGFDVPVHVLGENARA